MIDKISEGEEVTAQEVFELSILGVLRQRRRSMNARGKCRYRLEEGSAVYHCAVGHLIPREQYIDEIEGRDPKSALAILRGAGRPCHASLFPHHLLIRALQVAHDTGITDGIFPPKAIHKLPKEEALIHAILAMREVGLHHKLTIPREVEDFLVSRRVLSLCGRVIGRNVNKLGG